MSLVNWIIANAQIVPQLEENGKFSENPEDTAIVLTGTFTGPDGQVQKSHRRNISVAQFNSEGFALARNKKTGTVTMTMQEGKRGRRPVQGANDETLAELLGNRFSV